MARTHQIVFCTFKVSGWRQDEEQVVPEQVVVRVLLEERAECTKVEAVAAAKT